MSHRSETTDEQLLREKGLAFFGAITASVSHELNNVISIIDQTAGLLGDLLASSDPTRALDPERLGRIAANVTTQTERGVGIIKRLNTFAHCVDDARVEYDAVAVLENFAALTTRLASLKRAELQMTADAGEVALVGSPFQLQQALFLALKAILAGVGKGDSVTISLSPTDEGARFVLEGPQVETEKPFEPSYLNLLVARLGGQVAMNAQDGRLTFDLLVPRQGP
jgi:C4-dicarboxylate-specific signal transduction histidine kinase